MSVPKKKTNVIMFRGLKELPETAPKAVRTTTEAVILTKDAISRWKVPPFQRSVRVNTKVLALAEDLKCDGGVLSGALTIGVLDGTYYIVDGQHRLEAYKLSGLSEVYAEITVCHFESMADMAEKFVELNSKLVPMKPDDILRGLEPTSPGLQSIRKHCEFVGYDMIRRGVSSPVLSMSVMLRCWFGSAHEAPIAFGTSAPGAVKLLTEEEARRCVQFLNIAFGAWSRDAEYHRLWGSLNLSLCMWLWRRTVIEQHSAKTTKVSVQQFGKCLMSLSADGSYVDWLVGRNLGDRDRGPCYGRIRQLFGSRIQQDTGKKAMFPAPAWYLGRPKGRTV